MKSRNIFHMALAGSLGLALVSCQFLDGDSPSRPKVTNKPLPSDPTSNPYAPSLNPNAPENPNQPTGSGFYNNTPEEQGSGMSNNTPSLPNQPLQPLNPSQPSIPNNPTLPTPPRTQSNYPYATKIPNRPGWVFSPYTSERVDVSGIASGKLVLDPTAKNKKFRVP